MTGKDEMGIPMLHWRPDYHFERLTAFLAYRNVFTPQELARGGLRKGKDVVRRIGPLYDSRSHITSATSIDRLGNVLGSLIRQNMFQPTSPLVKRFADVTDDEILSRDPRVAHRIPIFYGPKGVMVRPESSITDWKNAKREEEATGKRLQEYAYPGLPARPLADFEEDPEDKENRQEHKRKDRQNSNNGRKSKKARARSSKQAKLTEIDGN